MKKNILVIGSSNTDIIIRLPRIPAVGETVLGEDLITSQGGKGANQAVAAARAGGEVIFIACLGNDDFSKQAIQHYIKNNIHVNHIFYDNTSPTGMACIFVDENGNNSIAVAPGANAKLSDKHILEKKLIIEQADVLLLQLEIPLSTVEKAINIAYQNQVPVILNPAPAQTLPIELLRKITIFTPNRLEVETLTGIHISDTTSAEQAANDLLDQGIPNVVITLGEKGALVGDKHKKLQFVPGYKVNAVDTTGAGDTFNGALSIAYSEGMPLIEAVKFANAAAALSTLSYGAQSSNPLRESVKSFMTT